MEEKHAQIYMYANSKTKEILNIATFVDILDLKQILLRGLT